MTNRWELLLCVSKIDLDSRCSSLLLLFSRCWRMSNFVAELILHEATAIVYNIDCVGRARNKGGGGVEREKRRHGREAWKLLEQRERLEKGRQVRDVPN